ncbi:MAG TPA: class I SAM-dependent methyltransferase [Acidimicrobiales bacterium]|nr:class I SAM-dependent methyltransferase [Acidimicrobiales bacterium]
MPIIDRLRASAISWGDSLLPPGPLRTRITDMARARGVTFAPSSHGVPDELQARHVVFDEASIEQLLVALKEDYFGAQTEEFGDVEEYLATDTGKADCRDHLVERLDRNRATVIPWLDHLKSLDGSRVLEIGAGDGASTVAMAEQGATVLATDVNERFLRVNAIRCKLAGLTDVRFEAMNSDTLSAHVRRGEYDVIVFFAALEHMTFDERMASLRMAWELLDPGGLLVVIETPNRLWYLDDHTAMTPFFHWLPDDVARRYASYTPRTYYNSGPVDGVDDVPFARWGRGVSFHDFVLALGIPAPQLPVAGCLHEYLDLPRWRRHTRDGRYLRFIRSLAPEVPNGFFYSYLDIALRR